MPVPPPMRAMGRLPAIWSRFIRHRAIKVAHMEAVGGGVKTDVKVAFPLSINSLTTSSSVT